MDEEYSKASVAPFAMCTLDGAKGLGHLGANALKGLETSEK